MLLPFWSIWRWSLSARRAWIEIKKIGCLLVAVRVALRKESVDRNLSTVQIVIIVVVALRKESVDRNLLSLRSLQRLSVALRKESVDRNKKFVDKRCKLRRSLSARRAWIEI